MSYYVGQKTFYICGDFTHRYAETDFKELKERLYDNGIDDVINPYEEIAEYCERLQLTSEDAALMRIHRLTGLAEFRNNIIREVDMVVLMYGYENDPIAVLEKEVAEKSGIEVMHEREV